LDKAYGDDLYKRPLRNLFVEGKDLEIIRIVYNYFVAVRMRWPEAWDARGQGYMLNRTNGVKALLRFFRYAYSKVAAPGDAVSSQKFLDYVFSRIELSDTDFTTENFLPGTSGEARLFRALRGKEEL
jgi:hypothetical protein